MTLSDLSSIGSFISGVAVVFSFIFLSLQMRQANINQKAIVHQNRITRSSELVYHLSEPGVFSAWVKGLRGDADMKPDDFNKFLGLARVAFWSFEDSYFQTRSGLMDEGAFQGVVRTYRRMFSGAGTRAAWKTMRDSQDPKFAEFCDEVAAEGINSAPLADFDNWMKLVERERALQKSV